MRADAPWNVPTCRCSRYTATVGRTLRGRRPYMQVPPARRRVSRGAAMPSLTAVERSEAADSERLTIGAAELRLHPRLGPPFRHLVCVILRILLWFCLRESEIMPTLRDMSKIVSYHHVVFGTKSRIPSLDPLQRDSLHRYITSIVRDEQCYLCRINSMPDHVHILLDLNPSRALSEVVGNIKSLSSGWIRREGRMPLFTAWCRGFLRHLLVWCTESR